MHELTASSQLTRRVRVWPALLCGLAGALLFHGFGNATRGYIATRSLFVWWGRQWFDPGAETQHGPLVLALSLWLFWRNLNRSRGEKEGPADRAGAAAMFGALVLHLAGFALQQTRLSIVALLLFAWGVLALAGGRSWARAAVFPLGFALLAVPISFFDSLGFNLRLAVAQQASLLAHRFGIDVLRNGTQLLSADGRFEYDVAAACSGIRSLVALLALALLLGYLGLRSWFPRLALAAACLPAAVIGNIVRVLAIIIAADRFGRPAAGTVHEVTGYLGFLVVLGLLCGLLALLRRLSRTGADAPPPASTTPPAPLPAGRAWRVAGAVVLGSALAAAAAAGLTGAQRSERAGIRLDAAGNPVDLPDFIGTDWIGRRVDVSALEREVLPADTGYSRRNYVEIADPSRQVYVSVVLSGRDRTSIHRPELCLVGQGWTIAGRSIHTFATPAGPVSATLLHVDHPARTAAGKSLVAHSLFAYWFVGAGTLESSHTAMEWRDAVDRIRHLRADRWAYVAAQTMVAGGDEAGALARMQEVLAHVWPQLEAGPAPAR